MVLHLSATLLRYQHAVSPRGEMDPLSIYPHSAGEAHGGQEGSGDRTCYFAHIIHPTQLLQFGACRKYAVPPLQSMFTDSTLSFDAGLKFKIRNWLFAVVQSNMTDVINFDCLLCFV